MRLKPDWVNNFFLNYYRATTRSKFVKNVMAMSIGVIISQALLMVFSPVLTRLFLPSALGVLAIFISIASVFSAFANGRYHVPIVLPKKDREAINIFALSILFAVFFSALITIFIFFLSARMAVFFHLDMQYAKWLYVIPFMVLMSGLFEPLNAWFVRKKLYWNLSVAKVSHSVSLSAVQLGTGVAGFGASGLVLGRAFGDAVRSFYLMGCFLKRYKNRFVFLSWALMKSVAYKYRDFFRYESVLTLVKTLSSEMPVFFLSSMFNASVTGFYLLSVRVISGPFSILELSMNQVFYREIVERYHRREDLHAFVKKTYWNLFKLAIIPHCIALFIMPTVFRFVFGKDWVMSGYMTQLMIPALLLSFLNSPVTTISQVLNKQKMLLVYSVFQLSCVAGMMWLSVYWYHNVLVTVAFLGLGLAIYHGFLMWYLLYSAKDAYGKEVYKDS